MEKDGWENKRGRILLIIPGLQILLLLSRFSRVRLCDPIDGSPPGSLIPGILQARTLNGLSFPSLVQESEKWKWSCSVVPDSLLYKYYSFPDSSVSKESACNLGDPGSIHGLGRSPGEGNGKPLQYSCLENPMDRGAWWAAVHGVAKSWPGLTYTQILGSHKPLFPSVVVLFFFFLASSSTHNET